MKKNLLTSMIAIVIMLYTINPVRSQCTVSDLAIELQSATTVGDSCVVVFNFSWTQEVNNGNKWAYIHLWNSTIYPHLEATQQAYTNSSDFPDEVDLDSSLTTIVITNNGSENPGIGNVYMPVPQIQVQSVGLQVIKVPIDLTRERMTVKNITVTVPNCSGSGITGDIWASQAANGQNVHCVSSDVTFVVGNPRVNGFLFCTPPRRYSVTITNLAETDIIVSYKVYLDEGDGVFEPLEHDSLITPIPYGPFTLSPNIPYQSGQLSYLPWSNTSPYANWDLWVEVSTVGIPNKTLAFIANTCIGLPVTLEDFTATRDQSVVTLKWETSSESLNRGFEIQKRTGNGQFITVAYVPSQAPDGNSSSMLYYTYNDINNERGITEYRLMQSGYNGETKYSDIRAVRGIAQNSGIYVYPNPAANGQVSVLLSDPGLSYDAQLIDMAGRRIRTWQNLKMTTVTITGLLPGVYTLMMTERGTRNTINFKILSN